MFNQTLAINTSARYGHLLGVDAFVNPTCSPYATPATIALGLKQYGPAYRQCYAWLGPNQPGVNETDPARIRRACVPSARPRRRPTPSHGPQRELPASTSRRQPWTSSTSWPHVGTRRQPRAGPANPAADRGSTRPGSRSDDRVLGSIGIGAARLAATGDGTGRRDRATGDAR